MKKDKNDIDTFADVNDDVIGELQSEIVELKKKIYSYRKFLEDNGLMKEAEATYISDEEFICLRGIESIKKLVINEMQTKDDINIFDTLYRNLNIIRNINTSKIKKEKSKTRSELLALVKKV